MGEQSRWGRSRRRRDAVPQQTTPDDVPADPFPADRFPADPFPAEPPEPLAEPVPEPAPPRLTIAAVRLAALGLALMLTIAITLVRLFVGGPPTVEQLRERAGVDGWTTLAVGVKDDQPGTAYFDRDTGIWSGFDIDIAYMIAEDLGFRRSEVRFFGMESEDRARMQADGPGGKRMPVQMVIASYSITPEREARDEVTFSQPYLFTEQSVLTLADPKLAGRKKVSALEEFKGRKVCTLSTATSAVAPNRAGAVVRSRNRVSECVEDLRKSEVDAITTDAAILGGYKARYPEEFDHWDLGLDTTERWGVNVGQNEDLKKLVDLTLYHSLKDPRDDRWELAYANNFQTEVLANSPPANIGHTPLAQAEQPDVVKPDVREQPWEQGIP